MEVEKSSKLVNGTLIGLVDGWANTQLLTKTKGYWKMSIVIFFIAARNC